MYLWHINKEKDKKVQGFYEIPPPHPNRIPCPQSLRVLLNVTMYILGPSSFLCKDKLWIWDHRRERHRKWKHEMMETCKPVMNSAHSFFCFFVFFSVLIDIMSYIVIHPPTLTCFTHKWCRIFKLTSMHPTYNPSLVFSLLGRVKVANHFAWWISRGGRFGHSMKGLTHKCRPVLIGFCIFGLLVLFILRK